MAEDDGARPNVVGLGGAFDEEFLREIQVRENSTTGDRDIDKVDRRIWRALRKLVISVNPSLIRPPADHVQDSEMLCQLKRLEDLAAEAQFAAAAKEIGLSRSIKQLRLLFSSASINQAVTREGAAPRDQMATFNIWILIETAKRAKNLKALGACKLLEKLGGIVVKKDAISPSSMQRRLTQRQLVDYIKRNPRKFLEIIFGRRLLNCVFYGAFVNGRNRGCRTRPGNVSDLPTLRWVRQS